MTKNEAIDDIEAYAATFSAEEREHLAVSDLAIDIAMLLYRAVNTIAPDLRQARGERGEPTEASP